MDKEDITKKKRALMVLMLVFCIVFLVLTIWFMFGNKSAELQGGVEEQDGPGEEVEYDVIFYDNIEVLETEIDEELVGTIRTEIDLALLYNSSLNTKQARSYEAVFSDPVPSASTTDGSALFYEFDLTISGADNGEAKYHVYVMIEGNSDPDIDTDYFTSVALAAKKNGFGNFIVTNSPNEAKVQNWAKPYVGNGLELIRSEIY